jgi:Asp-tRNA(Asn)/Glu-tRNA(Gln) amidotransferase B subunit
MGSPLKLLDPVRVNDVRAMLAADLAAELSQPEDIFARYGISQEQAIVLLKDLHFRHMVREAKREWQSEAKRPDRILSKSQIIVEDLLPELHRIGLSAPQATVKLEALKLASRLAGVDKTSISEGGVGGGRSFSITLNIGDRPLTISGKPKAAPMVDVTDVDDA